MSCARRSEGGCGAQRDQFVLVRVTCKAIRLNQAAQAWQQLPPQDCVEMRAIDFEVGVSSATEGLADDLDVAKAADCGQVPVEGHRLPPLGLEPWDAIEWAVQPTNDTGEPKTKALTDDELGRLLNEIPGEWTLFFEVLAHSGLRIGEATVLRWQDIDLGKHRLHVRRRLRDEASVWV